MRLPRSSFGLWLFLERDLFLGDGVQHCLVPKRIAGSLEIFEIAFGHVDAQHPPSLHHKYTRVAAKAIHEPEGSLRPHTWQAGQVVAAHENAGGLKLLESALLQHVAHAKLSATTIAPKLEEHPVAAERQKVAVFGDAQVDEALPGQVCKLRIGLEGCDNELGPC